MANEDPDLDKEFLTNESEWNIIVHMDLPGCEFLGCILKKDTIPYRPFSKNSTNTEFRNKVKFGFVDLSTKTKFYHSFKAVDPEFCDLILESCSCTKKELRIHIQETSFIPPGYTSLGISEVLYLVSDKHLNLSDLLKKTTNQ